MTQLNDRSYVLDSWPVIEWFYERQTVVPFMDEIFEEAVRGSATVFMSRINYGEIVYSCRRRMPQRTAETLLAFFQALPVEIVSVSDALVDKAAEIKANFSAAYADCFAAALAIEKNTMLVTGDKEFLPMQSDGLLQLHWLGA